MRSRRKRFTRHVARAYRIFGWGNPMEESHLENIGVDGRIFLKFIFKKI
jgi:hypothetical protein